MGAYDELFDLSDAQEITADAASTNYIDMEVVKSQLGVGGDVWLCIRTNTAPTDAADTIAIQLECDDNSSFSSSKNVLTICTLDTTEITVSDARFATAGAWIYRATLPYECDERYVRLYYENTTSNGTITLDAWLQTFPPKSDRTQVFSSPVGNP